NRFEFIASVGIGVNFAFDNEATTPAFTSVVGRVAIRANYNLTEDLDLYVEPAAYITDPEFDGYKGTAVGDLYTRLAVGVQYTFNKKGSSGKLTIDELDRLNRRVNENRDLIEKLGDRSKPASSPELLPEYIHFVLNSYRVGQSEYSKIEAIADFLKNNPDAKLLLVGYADKLTGTSAYNYNLSKKRAVEVRNELQRLGISDSRLFIEWKGDKEQPFTVNEWNRVVIMVERR
ncbi:MAG: OmpA family protein, partial [Dysgonamonadaceae bacterium]|nr:OmpA family protein [Dysgonamonadaceae bacterium]